MTAWTVTITATTTSVATSSRLEQLALLLKPYGAAIAGGALDHLSHDLEVTLTIDDNLVDGTLAVADPMLDITAEIPLPVGVGLVAVGLVVGAARGAGLGELTIHGLEIIDVDEHDRRLAEPAYAELVGITEIAAMLGVTRQRASALQTRSGFPQPLQVLASGPVWPRTWIDRFASTWERKGGRPAKQLPTSSTYSFDRDTDPDMARVVVGDEITVDGAPVRVAARWESKDTPMVTLHLEEITDAPAPT